MAAAVIKYHTRQRLAIATGAALLLAVVATATILLGMLLPRSWERASSVEQLRTNPPQLLNIAGHELYLLWENHMPLALSTRDPHGPYRYCDPRVRYDTESKHFIEPCGGSTYERDGSYVRGPSPRSLDRFPVRIHQGQIEIDIDEIIPGRTHA